jgi:predicted ribosomally synthesized peptide with SipW-like signal peptide
MNRTLLKILGSFAVLGAAASVAGLGTFASFTSSTSASQAITSGTVSITLGAAGAQTNRLNIPVSNVVPGDTIQRSVDLINNGTITADTLSSIQLTTSATITSLLDTDVTNGLQMVVDKCPVAWTEGGSAPAYTYTCTGAIAGVLASHPVVGAALPLTGLASLTNGATDHLRVTLTLPSTADNTFQNKSSSILYSFVGTQRLASAK